MGGWLQSLPVTDEGLGVLLGVVAIGVIAILTKRPAMTVLWLGVPFFVGALAVGWLDNDGGFAVVLLSGLAGALLLWGIVQLASYFDVRTIAAYAVALAMLGVLGTYAYVATASDIRMLPYNASHAAAENLYRSITVGSIVIDGLTILLVAFLIAALLAVRRIVRRHALLQARAQLKARVS